MKRWQLRAGASDLGGLEWQDVPTSEPGPGQVRVRVRAAALNRRDQMVLERKYFGDPDHAAIVPLSDAAGEVDAIGPGVTLWRVGDRVTSVYLNNWPHGRPRGDTGAGPGSAGEAGWLAEQVVVPAERITRAAATLDFAEAATLVCAGLTAWNALTCGRRVGPGDRVLTMGSGGVSVFAAQFARLLGATVIATTGSDDKADRLRALGAGEVLNYHRDKAWGKAAFDRFGGVDQVVNIGGAGALDQALAAVRFGGEIATIGFLAGEAEKPLDVETLLFRNATIRGLTVGSVALHEAMVAAVDASGLKPTIGQRFAFAAAPDAFRGQLSPDAFGKTVIEFG